MLLSPQPRLEEVVVTTLAKRPAQTVEELTSLIEHAGYDYSIPSIYQELRKLRAQGIIQKHKTRYSLRIGWMLELIQLTDSMYDTYLQEGAMHAVLPAEGERLNLQFSSMKYLVEFWTQLDLVLCQEARDRTLFEWAPHAWFDLANYSNESQFINGMSIAGNRYYLIAGADTFLDRRYVRSLRDLNGEVSFAESPFHKEQNTYYSVAGDYVVTVKLTKQKTEEISALFAATKSSRELLRPEVVSTFTGKTKVRFQLEHNVAKASRLGRRFRKFFGLAKE